jgi:hypothetical protein
LIDLKDTVSYTIGSTTYTGTVAGYKWLNSKEHDWYIIKLEDGSMIRVAAERVTKIESQEVLE